MMPMYNLIEYSHDYEKTFSNLLQYYRHEADDNISNSEPSLIKIY